MGSGEKGTWILEGVGKQDQGHICLGESWGQTRAPIPLQRVWGALLIAKFLLVSFAHELSLDFPINKDGHCNIHLASHPECW